MALQWYTLLQKKYTLLKWTKIGQVPLQCDQLSSFIYTSSLPMGCPTRLSPAQTDHLLLYLYWLKYIAISLCTYSGQTFCSVRGCLEVFVPLLVEAAGSGFIEFPFVHLSIWLSRYTSEIDFRVDSYISVGDLSLYCHAILFIILWMKKSCPVKGNPILTNQREDPFHRIQCFLIEKPCM